MTDETVDYIVVGAGAAGCALAARLTENASVSVLLLEAGGSDKRLWVRVPLGVGKLLGDPDILWQAQTCAEPGLRGNRIAWPSGKLLGGSSSVNGMLVVRGNPTKYDEWEASGARGWAFNDLLPYFKKMEDCQFGDPAYRGKCGPVGVEEATHHVLGDAFMSACESAGYPRAIDYNGAVPEGAAPFQMNIRNGVRCSASSAYLRPALNRPNLQVRCNSVAQRVLFRDRRAAAVEYRNGDGARTAYARREVILCAGAVRSPQLLELSGVGDAEVLRRFEIPLLQHLPGVGSNLQDHLMVRICYQCKNPVTVYDLLHSPTRMAWAIARYILVRQGIFATSSFPALAFLRTSVGEKYPDARIQIGLTSGAGRLSTSRNSGLDPHSGFHLGGYLMYPRSRGYLHIKSRDAGESAEIQANYLTDPADCAVTLRILKILRKLASQPSLAAHIVTEVRPGSNAVSDESLLEYARLNGDTCWHPCGTCKMGSGPDAVVDSALRVRGIEGLRVADASVFPFMVSSNTNFPTIMVGERAADLIMNRATGAINQAH